MLQRTGTRKGSGWARCLAQIPGLVWPVHSANHRMSHMDRRAVGCQASPREPRHSLAALPLGEHEGCPLAALGSLLAAFAPGGCTGREQPGQLQVPTGHRAAPGPCTGPSRRRPQPSLDAEQPGLTVTVEVPRCLQDLPRAGQVSFKNQISWVSTWVAGLPA